MNNLNTAMHFIPIACNCAGTPPTMPSCRSTHLPSCPLASSPIGDTPEARLNYAARLIESEIGDLLAAIGAGDPNADASISERARAVAQAIFAPASSSPTVTPPEAPDDIPEKTFREIVIGLNELIRLQASENMKLRRDLAAARSTPTEGRTNAE